jgi:hypothetical protein
MKMARNNPMFSFEQEYNRLTSMYPSRMFPDSPYRTLPPTSSPMISTRTYYEPAGDRSSGGQATEDSGTSGTSAASARELSILDVFNQVKVIHGLVLGVQVREEQLQYVV